MTLHRLEERNEDCQCRIVQGMLAGPSLDSRTYPTTLQVVPPVFINFPILFPSNSWLSGQIISLACGLKFMQTSRHFYFQKQINIAMPFVCAIFLLLYNNPNFNAMKNNETNKFSEQNFNQSIYKRGWLTVTWLFVEWEIYGNVSGVKHRECVLLCVSSAVINTTAKSNLERKAILSAHRF